MSLDHDQQIERDAKRYRTLRDMPADYLNYIIRNSETNADFDAMVDSYAIQKERKTPDSGPNDQYNFDFQ